MENKKNKKKLYIVLIVFILLVAVISTTYAIFVTGIKNDVETNLAVKLDDSVSILFEQDDDLIIDATASNFLVVGDHLYSSAIARATLTSLDDYTANYYLYFYIEENEFVYTTEENLPELILQVTGPNGEVTEIEGLEYTESSGIKGFDVTISEGVFAIENPASLVNINDNGNEVVSSDEYTFTLYFIALETNQNENSNKSFIGNIIMDVEEFAIPLVEKILIDNARDEDNSLKTVDLATKYIENKEYVWGTAIDYDAGLYATPDQTGNNSYFFAGAVEDNYLYFAGFYWRIVRIDGDGNIKLIYAGETVDATGVDAQIGTSAFNALNNNTVYTGYVYSTSSFRGTTTDSTIKDFVDDWYAINIENNGYNDYVAETLYCIDRDAYATTTGGTVLTSISTATHYYGAYVRLAGNNEGPTIECNGQSNDNFDLYVGLISADEAAFINGTRVNQYTYLVSGSVYWTLTPWCLTHAAFASTISNVGYISAHLDVSNNLGVRPTISLKASTVFTVGDGTAENPYIVGE